MKSFEYIKNFIITLSNKPGVYRMMDEKGTVLYVGKAKNLKNRVTNYTSPARLNNRIIRMIEQVVQMEVIETKSEGEALLLEASLIKALKPRYNILLRDDKTFPYIQITTDHEYPQVLKYRGKKHKDGVYFGPFASARDVTKTIEEIQKVFLLRNCSDHCFNSRKRPCLEYQIKKCSAPCVSFISKEEYKENVDAAISFLKGDTTAIKASLADKMNASSTNMEYEAAARYRDRIKALNTIEAKTRVNLKGEIDVDAIGMYRIDKHICIQIFFFRGGQSYGNRSYFPAHAEGYSDAEVLDAFLGLFYQNRVPPKTIWMSGDAQEHDTIQANLSEIAGYKVKITVPKRGEAAEIVGLAVSNAESSLKKKMEEENKYEDLLSKIKQTFEFKEEITRIEVYDNSHISGTNAVGAMIVAGKEGFIKSEYKKFNIRDTDIGDDYQMLREVLTRRLKRLKDKDYTGYLLLIDGGKGQRTIVEEVFSKMGFRLPYLCIAKGKDRNAGREKFYNERLDDITFDKNEEIMKYLQILRDEAHRFAIETHRKLRSKELKTSQLDSIPGIGKFKKAMLLNYFGSVEAIRSASIDDIAKAPGFDKKTAKKIKDALL